MHRERSRKIQRGRKRSATLTVTEYEMTEAAVILKTLPSFCGRCTEGPDC